MLRFPALLLIGAAAFAQRPVADPPAQLLWPGGAPGALGTEDRDKPTLTAWIPQGARNGQAVVVCPGGGYGALAIDHEGKQIAQWLNSQGIAAFVLKYRLGPHYRHPAPLNDAQMAIKTVRAKAAEYGIDPKRIGIWGFSAGGHLASPPATLFTGPDDRPDFAVPAYPVITSTEEAWVHKGSRRNLLGDAPSKELMKSLSTEYQIKKDTPPIFLFHTSEDKGVPPENSIVFYLACRQAGVPVEMHVYEKGPHGVGLGWADIALSSWPGRLSDWLRRR